jgi:hypothetical protein
VDRPIRPRRAKPKRRETIVRVVMVALLMLVAFFLGISVARTLDERPKPGGVVTDVRTLTPLPQQPPARTVTVTVTSP